MSALSTLPQVADSETKLTRAEAAAERAVAREIIVEILAAAGLDASLVDRIKITSGPKLTSTMGHATTHGFGLLDLGRLDLGATLRGTMRLSSSGLWRRASQVKRRNTVVHELAHLVANWRAGRGVGHGPLWKREMVRFGEKPVRCHSVAPVHTGKSAKAAEYYAENTSGADQIRFGDIVVFGKPNGEQTRARVAKVNLKSIKLVLLEPRGRGGRYPVGAKFGASPSLCRKVEK